MISQVCTICSGNMQWDDGASSTVCMDCGYMEDSSQTVLTNSQDFGGSGGQTTRADITFNPLNGLLRTSNGKALYGQSSKSRQDAAHTREMHQYVVSILRRISQPGLFERSCYLFDLGMQRAKYRWGRRARLCAGACVLIALNEQQKGETAATVAVIISEPILAVTKVYSRLIRLFQISNVNLDPSLLLPSLHVHMRSLLKDSKKLTNKLKKFLESLDPTTVLDTATDLASLLAASEGTNLTPIPAAACSIYILSLEAVALKPIPDLMQIAELLGVRFGSAGAGASKWCITDRYNTFLPSILEWKTGLPWADASISTSPSSKLRKAPRIEVAKCLRDVVIFRAKLNVNHLAGKFAPLEGPTFHCDQKPAADLDVGRVLPPLKRSLEEAEKGFVKKQRMDLGCSGESEYSSETRSAADTQRWLQSLSRFERLLTKAPEPRLTRLKAIRAKCEGEGREVADEELFEHGELEGLMRSEQEVEILRKVRGWEGSSHDSSQTRQDALMDDLHVKGVPAEKGTPAFGAGEEEEVVEEWRPLSPTSMSLSFFQEEFDDW